jgi:hypothetical protein
LAKLGVLLMLLVAAGCWSAPTYTQPDQADPATQAGSTPAKKKWQGMVATDNPYMISKKRLEDMDKGGLSGY